MTLALGLPVALASVSLSALLNSRVVAGDVFFVLLIFGAVYSRRFGDRGTALGLIGFQIYFLSLFIGATVSTLPRLYGVIGVAFACSALVRFALVPETPTGTLDRLRRAFRARFAQLVTAQLALLDAGSDDMEKALDDVREGTAPAARDSAADARGGWRTGPPTRRWRAWCNGGSPTRRSRPNGWGSCC